MPLDGFLTPPNGSGALEISGEMPAALPRGRASAFGRLHQLGGDAHGLALVGLAEDFRVKDA